MRSTFGDRQIDVRCRSAPTGALALDSVDIARRMLQEAHRRAPVRRKQQ